MPLNPFPGGRHCPESTHDLMVDRKLGQAYKTVKYIYDNWETLKLNYDLLVLLPEAVWTFNPADYATAAQGVLASTAVQPEQVSSVGFSGLYTDLLNRPTLGTAAAQNVDAFATAAQGTKADEAIPTSRIGIANGVTPLDVNIKVPAAFLPSFVDDVLEFASLANFPAPGEAGKIYVAIDTNLVYRWSGTVYTEISPSPGSTDAVPEGALNQYFTVSRAIAALNQYGLGATSIQVSNNIDSLDNATASGFYRAAAGAPNNPTATGAFLGVHMPSGSTATYGAQMGISESDARIYTRLKTNGTWGAWVPSAFNSQVVHNTGDESVGGAKTFSNTATFTLGAIVPGNSRVVFRTGATEYASVRGTDTSALVLAGANGGQIFLRPNGDQSTAGQINILSTGAMTFAGDAAAKTATRVSLGAVGLTGDETIAGAKTFSGVLTSTGNVVSGNNFTTSTAAMALGPGSSGTLYLRPAGVGSTSGQWSFTSTVARMGCDVTPATDNTYNVGSASLRPIQYFAVNSTISTSDERLKKNFRKLTPEEIAAFTAIQDLDFVWEWLNDGDRIHSGPTVQAVEQVMIDHGLDPWAYGFMCYDAWEEVPPTISEVPAEYKEYDPVIDDEGNVVTEGYTELVREAYTYTTFEGHKAGNRYSFRKDELILWITAANHARLKRLEALL